MQGDGIRRNIATVTQAERDAFSAAITKLNDGTLTYSDGRTFFQKQEWVHWAGHDFAHEVGGGVAFMGWHRELCNRFEALLRVVDPTLSLHYWDWTTDPRATPDGLGGTVNLLTSTFMGGDGSSGTTEADWGAEVGAPFANFQTIISGQAYPELGGAQATGSLADKPGHTVIWRAVGPNATNPPL
jgi:hypothetical protein